MLRRLTGGMLISVAGILATLDVYAVPLLKPQPAIALPGKAAAFDFMAVDADMGRLLASHKGNGTLTVFDLGSAKLVREVPTGAAQGVAVNPHNATYIVGDDDEQKVVIVDAKTLAVSAEVPVKGSVDAVAIDVKTGMVYADKDKGSALWVIDPKTKTVIATIELPGDPEYIAYNPVTDRLYQSIKTKNSVVVIDPATNKIEATWSTAPATSPHGLAIDERRGRLFVAGQNGKLVGLDLKSGSPFAVADIAPKVDQIVFDAERQIIYTGSKGFISAVQETDTALQSIGDTPAPAGAKTLAVDPHNHSVWVSYFDKSHSYLKQFRAP